MIQMIEMQGSEEKKLTQNLRGKLWGRRISPEKLDVFDCGNDLLVDHRTTIGYFVTLYCEEKGGRMDGLLKED
jgi:hypothetical protein